MYMYIYIYIYSTQAIPNSITSVPVPIERYFSVFHEFTCAATSNQTRSRNFWHEGRFPDGLDGIDQFLDPNVEFRTE